ncbi:MAG: hypothetical protein ACRDZT_04150, partial [Acidimicrobiales bacterium]
MTRSFLEEGSDAADDVASLKRMNGWTPVESPILRRGRRAGRRGVIVGVWLSEAMWRRRCRPGTSWG